MRVDPGVEDGLGRGRTGSRGVEFRTVPTPSFLYLPQRIGKTPHQVCPTLTKTSSNLSFVSD